MNITAIIMFFLFVGVTLVLATAALAACFFPAYKASRADPLETLRAE